MRASCLAVVLCLLCFSSFIRADEFAGFRIPEHRVHSLRGDVVGTYLSSDSYYSPNYAVSDIRHNTSLEGKMLLSGAYLQDSDRRWLSIISSVAAAGIDIKQSSLSHNGSLSELKEKNVGERWEASVQGRIHPLTVPLGIEGSLIATGLYGQSWKTVKDAYHNNPPLITHAEGQRTQSNYQYYFTGNASVGWGRVREVSVVYDVTILERRLQDCGMMTRPLQQDTKQKLMDLLYVQSDLKSVHERPARFFWKEMQAVLEADGGVKPGGLDAYALYRVAEPYLGQYNVRSSSYSTYQGIQDDEGYRYRTQDRPSFSAVGSFSRYRGYFVGLTAEFTHAHDVQRLTTETMNYTEDDSAAAAYYNRQYVHENSWSDVLSIGGRFEIHKPIGMRLQLDGSTRVLFPQQDAPKAMKVSSRVTATYLVADRWLCSVSALQFHNIQRINRSNALERIQDDWGTDLAANLAYYIEDNLALSLQWENQQNKATYRYANYDNQYAVFYRQSNYNRYNIVYLGITYHILGKMSAPGVITSSLLPLRTN
jgi:hypothetical protein